MEPEKLRAFEKLDILPHRHFKMKRITQVLPRRAVISRAGSGAWKSPSSMVQAPLRREISRLRVSKEYNTFSLIPACRSARDDAAASPNCHLIKSPRVIEENMAVKKERPPEGNRSFLFHSIRPITAGSSLRLHSYSGPGGKEPSFSCGCSLVSLPPVRHR